MTEHSISFSAPLIGPTRRGEKTNTRRVAPIFWDTPHRWGPYDCWTFAPRGRPLIGFTESNRGQDVLIPHCPYGTPGDHLWVREAHWKWGRWVQDGLTTAGRRKWRFEPVADPVHTVSFEKPVAVFARRGGGDGWVYRHARFMLRADSRLTLEVTSVRVERVQAITAEDARAEGINPDVPLAAARAEFARLWDRINGDRPGCSWENDPWVWVVGFKLVNETPRNA